jgi:hypothetical protein
MSDPKVKTLSEEYPHCARARLTINYNAYYGAFILAEQAERILSEMYLRNESLARMALERCKSENAK